MTAQCIINRARELVGTSFHHQGRQPFVGLDCAGLVIDAHRHCGYEITDLMGYGRLPNPRQMRNALAGSGLRVRLSERRPGDVLWFRVAGDPRHLAVYTGETMIHAYYHSGRVVENTLTRLWLDGAVAVYRHPGLVDE